MKAVKAAALSELEGVVPKSAALAVYKYFHQEEEQTCE